MSIYRGPGGAGDATNDATITQVQQYATEAATSATNAANSATSASTSASSASTQASNASTSASTATGQASAAAASASAAATSATNAANSATSAANQVTTATTQANNAASSANAAASSASTAASSASAAATSASSAATSATAAEDAVDSALAIYGSTQELEDAVAAAETAASNALGYSETAEDYALDASGFSSVAQSNANAAQTYSNNAATSASAASVSASNASSSATSAANSAASALAIYGSTAAVNAAVANSQANRDAAAASATAASNSASAASTSATSAATSATNAATSAAQASAVALGNEPVRHSVRPSLLLDFANTKTLDPRITFTRASTATFYDGKTVAKAEENLLQYSQEFDNAYWGKTNTSVTANSTTAPDGTTTAETMTASATTGDHALGHGIVIPSNTQATISRYVKAGTHNFVTLGLGGSAATTWFAATFNLSTVAVTKTGAGAAGTYTSSSITSVGNNWYRISVTGQIGVVSLFSNLQLASSATPTYGSYGSDSWTAAGTETIFVWGAQLEQRSSVTAYTATTTAPITNYIPALQTAAANVARFEHNPVTGESLGLEIEEQRTNLLTYSEQFNDASWTKNGNPVITTNTIVAPDGTLSGEGMNTASSTNTFGIFKSYSGTTGQTFSVYAKAGDASFLTLDTTAAGNCYAVFNLSTGVVVTSVGNTATITAVGNGWYRCVIANTTVATLYAIIGVRESYTNNNPWSNSVGTGKGIYIWGAQLEAGSFATSYIPTVASQVTRSADSASMTGTNFSSWYRADEGTLYSEETLYAKISGAYPAHASIDDGSSANNRIAFLHNGGVAAFNPYMDVTVNSSSQAGMPSAGFASPTIGTPYKQALVYKVNDFAYCYNGGTVYTDTLGTLPVPDRFSITKSSIAPVTIKKLAYYPKRLTNAELQGLTTV